MNERIKELKSQAYQYADRNTQDGDNRFATLQLEKFAELIIQDAINMMRQEWYTLNNLPKVENESPRDVGLRVGRKGEIISLMEKIKQHFGVET